MHYSKKYSVGFVRFEPVKACLFSFAQVVSVACGGGYAMALTAGGGLMATRMEEEITRILETHMILGKSRSSFLFQGYKDILIGIS